MYNYETFSKFVWYLSEVDLYAYLINMCNIFIKFIYVIEVDLSITLGKYYTYTKYSLKYISY